MRVLAALYDARHLLLLVSELPDKSTHLTSCTLTGVLHTIMAKTRCLSSMPALKTKSCVRLNTNNISTFQEFKNFCYHARESDTLFVFLVWRWRSSKLLTLGIVQKQFWLYPRLIATLSKHDVFAFTRKSPARVTVLFVRMAGSLFTSILMTNGVNTLTRVTFS